MSGARAESGALRWAWRRACEVAAAGDAALLAELEATAVREAGPYEIVVEGVDAAREERWRGSGVLARLEASLARDLGRAPRVRFTALRARTDEEILAEHAAREAAYLEEVRRAHARSRAEAGARDVLVGRAVRGDALPLDRLPRTAEGAVVEGVVFRQEARPSRAGGGGAHQWWITDRRSSLVLRLPLRPGQEPPTVAVGEAVRARGTLGPDRLNGESVLVVRDLMRVRWPEREDPVGGRVELHAHTRMSAMDAPLDVRALFDRARRWRMPAVAVTDHHVVQAFPEAAQAQGDGVRALYGVEASVVDDARAPVTGGRPIPLGEAEVVVVDLETTGLLPVRERILEIGAVRLGPGGEEQTFHTLVRHDGPIPPQVTAITGIRPEMLAQAPPPEEALAGFWRFVGSAALAAHNAEFDIGFLRLARGGRLIHPVIDTLALARALYPELKNHRLDTLARHLEVPLERHHRALDDARATAHILRRMLADAQARWAVRTEADLGRLTVPVTVARPYGAVLLARTPQGLRDLYALISASHLETFRRVPRIPLSRLTASRSGLLVGSPVRRGEVLSLLLMGADPEEIERRALAYDYLEVAPPDVVTALWGEEGLGSEEAAREAIARLVDLGERLGRPVVAVSDAHVLDPEDRVFRRVLTHGGNPELEGDGPFHLRTAAEMLEDFAFLGPERARRVVLDEPAAVAAAVEDLVPVPDELAAPEIATAEQEVEEGARGRARALYGDPLPRRVADRLERELRAVVGNGYASIYATASRLVKKSLADGYLVGSRGSVGSSLVAHLMDITEVNPLDPHYRCPGCRRVVFADEIGVEVESGFDLPPRTCECGEGMVGDGQSIPFETFMGFEGDKVPDIDLNFSGEYQPVIHRYTEEIFGAGGVFRAGTISTVAERTAYGLVKGYLRERGETLPAAEVDRLAMGITGVKRTTGQHPGGLMIVPRERDVHEFTPIQRPADDVTADVITTHFDYHSIEGRLLKLDLLGHDDPTVLRLLQELTGVDPRSVPLTDPDVLELFRSTRPLGVAPEEIGTDMGTLGIPEFGTRFVRAMLRETLPRSFGDLVRVSGLSHGTDVWANNAQDLVRAGTATLRDVIATREDMIAYLSARGLSPATAFAITERVRKGRGLRPEDVEAMRAAGVPDWYIASCQKITYLFPKAHAVAYVTMALRIAYFKVHHPQAHYAALFTVRGEDVDADLLRRGPEAVARRMREIEAMGNEASPKDRGQLSLLEIAREMFARGIRVRPVDLYASSADRFLVTDEGLLPPFLALPGLGRAAAAAIVQARAEGPFTSVENLRQRARLQRPILDLLAAQGCLEGLPQTNQLTLF